MTLHQCECCTEVTTRAELESRHGTLASFRRSVENAVGKWISWSEADAAIEAYRRRWDAAPEGER